MKNRPANAVIIALILVVAATMAGFVTFKVINKMSGSTVKPDEMKTQVVTQVEPTQAPKPSTMPTVDPSDTGLDNQLNRIQTHIDTLNSDQSAYNQIDQNADNQTP